MNLTRFMQALSLWDREYDAGDDTTLRDRIARAKDYVDTQDDKLSARIDAGKTYVDNHIYRAEVVSTLPTNAPAGYLMITPGDINLYIGTGMTTPLRRIPTQQLP